MAIEALLFNTAAVCIWILLGVVPVQPHQQQYTAIRCRRIPTPKSFSSDGHGAFSPAMVKHSTFGWILMTRFDACFYAKEGCTVSKTASKPLVSFLGHGKEPDFSLAANSSGLWTYDQSFQNYSSSYGANNFVAGDFRCGSAIVSWSSLTIFCWASIGCRDHFICLLTFCSW